jgi:hypothetical protein
MKIHVRFLSAALAALSIGLASPAALAAAWAPEVRLTNAVGHSWAPRLAAYNGTVHAVWFDYVGALADSEILYSRSTDNGLTWSAPINLSVNSGRPDIDPEITVDASGVYVLWSSNIVSGELYFRRSHDNGSSWRPEQQLTNGAGYSRSGGLAVDTSGTLHAVYYDDRVGYSNLYHVQSCDHGTTWTAEQNITANDGVVDNEVPRLTVGQDGKLYLAFRSSREGSPQGGWPPYQIYLLRGTPAACPSNPAWLYPAQRVTRGLPDEYSDAYSPEIATGSGGSIHIAFWDQLAGNDVGYRRLDPAASGFGPLRRLGALGANHPQAGSTNAEAGNLGISEDNAGTLHLLFGENAGTTASVTYGRLFYRGSPDRGVTWSAVQQVGTTTMAAMPRFLYARGRVHAAWTDFRDNNVGGEIYYRYYDLQQTDMIAHFYQSILNRAPDAGGNTAWQNELSRVQALGLDGREMFLLMSGYFFNSAEYQFRGRDNTQFASDLFQTFFNRAPDAGSLSFWVSQLDAGAPRDMVRYAFALSSEADTYMRFALDRTDGRAGDTMISDFYRSILNRLPDNNAFVAWRNAYRTAQCSGSAAVLAQATAMSQSFFNSAEYSQRGRDNVGYMQDLYMALMRRYATLYELWSWTNAINNGVYTRDQVRTIFLGSLEFQLRVNRVVQEGCLH